MLRHTALTHLRPLKARGPKTYVPDFSFLPGQMQTFPSLSFEERFSLRAGAHLRNPLGRHKAGGFYNGESCFRKHVYQPDFHCSGYEVLQWRQTSHQPIWDENGLRKQCLLVQSFCYSKHFTISTSKHYYEFTCQPCQWMGYKASPSSTDHSAVEAASHVQRS